MSRYEQQIRNAVSLRGTVSVQDLASILDVSDQTVRRVIRPLVERGEVRKVHGAIVSTKRETDPPFLSRMALNRTAKVAIASEIAGIVDDGDSLAIDTGSTSAFVAQSLQQRRDLTVVTNSAFVASTLAMVEGNKVFMAGTQLRDHDGAAFDRAAFEVIERISVAHAILSASRVTPGRGFLVYEQCEADIANAMMGTACRTIMAVDQTKFDADDSDVGLLRLELGAGDLVVTDAAPQPAFSNLFSDVELRVCSKG